MKNLTFPEFQASQPARQMFEKLRLLDHLEQATSWRMLRALIVNFNDADVGRFVNLVRTCDGVCSSGERPLLHAIAAVCDFAWLADELVLRSARRQNGIGPWERMSKASGDHLRCVAACILAADEM